MVTKCNICARTRRLHGRTLGRLVPLTSFYTGALLVDLIYLRHTSSKLASHFYILCFVLETCTRRMRTEKSSSTKVDNIYCVMNETESNYKMKGVCLKLDQRFVHYRNNVIICFQQFYIRNF